MRDYILEEYKRKVVELNNRFNHKDEIREVKVCESGNKQTPKP